MALDVQEKSPCKQTITSVVLELHTIPKSEVRLPFSVVSHSFDACLPCYKMRGRGLSPTQGQNEFLTKFIAGLEGDLQENSGSEFLGNIFLQKKYWLC